MPVNIRFTKRETTKVAKYQKLKEEIRRMSDIRSAKVVPLTVGALKKTTENHRAFFIGFFIEQTSAFSKFTCYRRVKSHTPPTR